jgi:hypothetical protein
MDQLLFCFVENSLSGAFRINDFTSSTVMKLALSFLSLPPKSHNTALLDAVSVFTRNEVARDRTDGRRTRQAMCSGKRSARTLEPIR